MTTLMDTEEMMVSLSVRLRVIAYCAMDASNHLAVHSANASESVVMHEVAQRLSELAQVTRSIGEIHTRT